MDKNLKELAHNAYKKAYAPYSKFHVGAAVKTESNACYSGCNVENASYGLTICAERNAIANMVVNQKEKLLQVVIYTEAKKLTPPCGACRQVIAEFADENTQVIATNHLNESKVWTAFELLPDAFTPEDLDD